MHLGQSFGARCVKRRFLALNLSLGRYMLMHHWGIYRKLLVCCTSLRLLMGISLMKQKVCSRLLLLYIRWSWLAPRRVLRLWIHGMIPTFFWSC
ncbi:hypothetical protein E1A91_A12G175000v1 [Gossypium mustelinum]|uniref:Uncharacterized protein n=1 Tax=Gossypium mustelinum TaxID=34275 RepID=A0A5D2WVN5_GOSMU|nr:hypothetical protein E1A91_A12G175000v1 [Gossypium mustelinum]